MNDTILQFVEDKLNDLIEATETAFPNNSIAVEVATAAATLAAQFAKAGGTNKKEFLSYMKTIYEEATAEEFDDVSQMN